MINYMPFNAISVDRSIVLIHTRRPSLLVLRLGVTKSFPRSARRIN